MATAFIRIAGGVFLRIIPCQHALGRDHLVLSMVTLGGRRARSKSYQVVQDLLKQVPFAVQEFLRHCRVGRAGGCYDHPLVHWYALNDAVPSNEGNFRRKVSVVESGGDTVGHALEGLGMAGWGSRCSLV